MRPGLLRLIGVALLCFSLFEVAAATESSNVVEVTEMERQWLKEHSPIRVGITPEWGPFSYFTESGQPAGIDVDLLKIIASRTGVSIEIIPATPWEKMYQMVKDHELDMTTGTVDIPEREEVFKFTRPYAISTTVIAAHENDHRFNHILQLRHGIVAQPAKYLTTISLRQRLPSANIHVYESQKECFEAILKNKADVTVVDMYTAAEYFNDHPHAKLGISGVIPEFRFRLCMAVRKDYDVLANILDRGLATVSQSELDRIIANHLAFKLEGSERTALLHKRFTATVLITATIIALLYFWNCWIRKEVRARRAAEAELRDMNRSLEVFAHAVSHDLRNPMRAVRGFTEAIAEDYGNKLDETARDYLSRMITAVARMEALISDVLAYSHASRSELNLKSVDLRKLIEDLIEEFPPEQRGYFHIDSDLPQVRANISLLAQCVGNLLTNAIKFVPKDRVPDVHIRAERFASRVKLIVSDNGIGIEPRDQTKIFQLFERVAPAGFSGTGIGLAVVIKGVERMGGSVDVNSHPGQGSEFCIRLPAAMSSA